MYSPKIYESQIPSLYHAAKELDVPMTQLVNAFVYYGLAAGHYGTAATDLLPRPNRVVPEGLAPKMQIFNPEYDSLHDYMRELPHVGTPNSYFQTLDKHNKRKSGTLVDIVDEMNAPFIEEEEEDDEVPF